MGAQGKSGGSPVSIVRTEAKLARTSLPTVVTLVGVTAILYVGREVFLPLAVALLLTFALAPIVSLLRKHSLPKIPAVILTVAVAFAVIALVSFVVATQVGSLAQSIPTYQNNVLEKIRSLRSWEPVAASSIASAARSSRSAPNLRRARNPRTRRNSLQGSRFPSRSCHGRARSTH